MNTDSQGAPLEYSLETPEASDSPVAGELVGRMTNVPAPPMILRQVLGVAGSGAESVESLASVLEADAALMTRLLRISNSAFCGLAEEVRTVRDAIIILGFDAVRSLTISAVAVRGVWVNDPLFEADSFWKHSLTCGLFAEAVGKRLQFRKPEAGFTVGVLHDIGRVVLIQSLPAECRAAAELARQERIPPYRAERRIIGFDHAEVGARVMEKWNLPAAYSQALRFHHEPEKEVAGREFTRVLALANAMTHYAFPGEDDTRCTPPLYRGLWEPLGLREDDIRALLELRDAVGLQARIFCHTVMS